MYFFPIAGWATGPLGLSSDITWISRPKGISLLRNWYWEFLLYCIKRLCIFGPKGAIQIRYYYYYYYFFFLIPLVLLLLLLLLKCVNVVDLWCARKAEISKAVDMYMFLFDDILLLTRVKKASRKVRFVFTSCQALQLYMDKCHLCLVASYFFVL